MSDPGPLKIEKPARGFSGGQAYHKLAWRECLCWSIGKVQGMRFVDTFQPFQRLSFHSNWLDAHKVTREPFVPPQLGRSRFPFPRKSLALAATQSRNESTPRRLSTSCTLLHLRSQPRRGSQPLLLHKSHDWVPGSRQNGRPALSENHFVVEKQQLRVAQSFFEGSRDPGLQ
jgi:hypothetical protein